MPCKRLGIFIVIILAFVSCQSYPPIIATGGTVSENRLEAVLDGLFNWARTVNKSSRTDLADLFVITVDNMTRDEKDCEVVQIRVGNVTYQEHLIRKQHITIDRKINVRFPDKTTYSPGTDNINKTETSKTENRILTNLNKAGFKFSKGIVNNGILKVEVSRK